MEAPSTSRTMCRSAPCSRLDFPVRTPRRGLFAWQISPDRNAYRPGHIRPERGLPGNVVDQRARRARNTPPPPSVVANDTSPVGVSMDVHNRLAQVALPLAFCLPAALPAQIATPAGATPATNYGHAIAAPSAIAVKRLNAVVLDGKLDDAAWKDAAAISDFTQ